MYQSTLRQSILASLAEREARNISALAQEIGYLRPSVSRTMKQLEHEGLVEHGKRVWCITEQGRKLVRAKEEVYTTHIFPLLRKIERIARQYDIPFIAAFEVGGWLKIEQHHIDACSELRCAYGELAGWEDE